MRWYLYKKLEDAQLRRFLVLHYPTQLGALLARGVYEHQHQSPHECDRGIICITERAPSAEDGSGRSRMTILL